MFASTPVAYREQFPPAQRYVRIPECVARAYGRPRNRTFREDGPVARPYPRAHDNAHDTVHRDDEEPGP
jgi:hypothetical protein